MNVDTVAIRRGTLKSTIGKDTRVALLRDDRELSVKQADDTLRGGADLLQRTFAVDVLACPECGGTWIYDISVMTGTK